MAILVNFETNMIQKQSMVILVNYKDNCDKATTIANKPMGFDLSQLNLVLIPMTTLETICDRRADIRKKLLIGARATTLLKKGMPK